jgi:hypothetical protein
MSHTIKMTFDDDYYGKSVHVLTHILVNYSTLLVLVMPECFLGTFKMTMDHSKADGDCFYNHYYSATMNGIIR